MAIRVYKPITNGSRQRSVLTSEEITKKAPEKGLLVTKKKTNGRNKTSWWRCKKKISSNRF